MPLHLPRAPLLWPLAGLAAACAGALVIARADLAAQREAFDTDARIAHRLLSQRAVEHDAILATLALLQPGGGDGQGGGAAAAPPEQRLPAVYPQVLRVLRRDRGAAWPAAALREAEAQSLQLHRAVLAEADFAQGRYTLLRAASPASHALQIELSRLVPWADWPLPRDTPVRLTLQYQGRTQVLQPGRADALDTAAAGPRGFSATKRLAADSQPFDLVATRVVAWRELPWPAMALWAAAALAVAAGLGRAHAAWQRQRQARRRAEARLRVDQAGRLNALGELAAGMAHELNQPLTALLAGTQAAQRLLAEDPPDLATARDAMARAAQQARRASDVVTRLRALAQRPAAEGPAPAAARALPLARTVRQALDLLQPECAARGVAVQLQATADPRVQADAVALEQIVHNLLTNALQALDQVPAAERRLAVAVGATGAQATLAVRDSGPGIAPDVLPRLFEPFFTTRADGLGLGLSLCETLAAGMGGTLQARQASPRGAEFRLTLPLAPPPAAQDPARRDPA